MGPHLTQRGLAEAYLVPSGILIHPAVWNRHGPKKWGGCAPLGELGLHLTQCRLGRGLPPYQVAS